MSAERAAQLPATEAAEKQAEQQAGNHMKPFSLEDGKDGAIHIVPNTPMFTPSPSPLGFVDVRRTDPGPLSASAIAALRWLFRCGGHITVKEARDYIITEWGTAVSAELHAHFGGLGKTP